MTSIQSESNLALAQYADIGAGQRLVRFLKMCGAASWGVSLGVIGLWILVGSGLPGILGGLSGFERAMVGLGMMSGGQMIFLIFVAERIFSCTPRGLISVAFWSHMLLGVGCLSLFILSVLVWG